MVARVLEQQASVRARFDALRTQLPPESLPSWEDFTWAWSVLESRGVYLNEASLGAHHQAISPIGDLFNHHESEPNVVATYDPYMCAYTYRTTRAVHEGEELCVQYGPHDDFTLLLSYGFVPAALANPHGRYLLAEQSMDAEGELSASDAEWLQQNGLANDRSLSADGASFALLAEARLRHADEAEREAGACFRILEGVPVSERNEQLVKTALQQLCARCIVGLAAADGDAAASSEPSGQTSDMAPTEAALAMAASRDALSCKWRINQEALLRAAHTSLWSTSQPPSDDGSGPPTEAGQKRKM